MCNIWLRRMTWRGHSSSQVEYDSATQNQEKLKIKRSVQETRWTRYLPWKCHFNLKKNVKPWGELNENSDFTWEHITVVSQCKFWREMLFSYNKWEFSSLHYSAQLHIFHYILSPTMLVKYLHFLFNMLAFHTLDIVQFPCTICLLANNWIFSYLIRSHLCTGSQLSTIVFITSWLYHRYYLRHP